VIFGVALGDERSVLKVRERRSAENSFSRPAA
jgi:hypothetical protein